MGSVLESRESSKNEDGKTDIIYKTMYANSEDFQVLAITTMVSSFVAEWNDQNMKLHHGEDLNSAKYSARPRLAVCCHQQRQYQTGASAEVPSGQSPAHGQRRRPRG